MKLFYSIVSVSNHSFHEQLILVELVINYAGYVSKFVADHYL